MTKLRYKLADIEAQISSNKEKYRSNVEAKVISSIKDDPSTFYRYARQKSSNRSYIGPYMRSNETITSDDKEMSDILAKQYAMVFSKPTSDITSEEFSVKLDEIPSKVFSEICEIFLLKRT